MFIAKQCTKSGFIELHHLGKIKIRIYINPLELIGDPIRQEIEHDFYISYEKAGVRKPKEIVSFSKPLDLFRNNVYFGREVIRNGLIPNQHPVVRYQEYHPYEDGVIDGAIFFGWEYIRDLDPTTGKLQNRVYNSIYSGEFDIKQRKQHQIALYLPGMLVQPINQTMPEHILRVLKTEESPIIL